MQHTSITQPITSKHNFTNCSNCRVVIIARPTTTGQCFNIAAVTVSATRAISIAEYSSQSSSSKLLYTLGPSYRTHQWIQSKVVRRDKSYIQYRDFYVNTDVKSLFTIRSHFQITLNQLTFVNAKGFSQKQSGLVPMSSWLGWTSLKSYILI